MAQQVYDASKVISTAKNKVVTGFKKGTFVTAGFDEDRVNVESNAQGEASWSLNNSGLGTMVFTLAQTSPFCKFFNDLNKTKEFFPCYVDDPANRERRGGTEAMVTKIADATYSDGIEARTYTVKVGDFTVTNY